MHEWCIILKPYISNSAYHAISSLKYHLNDPHKNNNKCSNRSGKWHYNGIINNTVGCIKLLKGSHIYSRYHFWFIQRCLLVCQCFANALSWKTLYYLMSDGVLSVARFYFETTVTNSALELKTRGQDRVSLLYLIFASILRTSRYLFYFLELNSSVLQAPKHFKALNYFKPQKTRRTLNWTKCVLTNQVSTRLQENLIRDYSSLCYSLKPIEMTENEILRRYLYLFRTIILSLSIFNEYFDFIHCQFPKSNF